MSLQFLRRSLGVGLGFGFGFALVLFLFANHVVEPMHDAQWVLFEIVVVRKFATTCASNANCPMAIDRTKRMFRKI